MTRAVLANVLTREKFTWGLLQAIRTARPARFIPQAVDGMLRHEERGVRLEEECIPHPGCFRFGDGLLEHYANVTLDDALDADFSRLLFSDGLQAWWNHQRDQRLARWLTCLLPPH